MEGQFSEVSTTPTICSRARRFGWSSLANWCCLPFSGVNMAGKEESGTRKLRPDGNEYPITEAPDIVELAGWSDPYFLETSAKSGGMVIGQGGTKSQKMAKL
jgi:hypothetical protein